jgi:hypothetical protein
MTKDERWKNALKHAKDLLDSFNAIGPMEHFRYVMLGVCMELYMNGDRSNALLEYIEDMKIEDIEFVKKVQAEARAQRIIELRENREAERMKRLNHTSKQKFG